MNFENFIVRAFAALALALLGLLPAKAADQHSDKESCKTINGEYKHWDGHPPYERVETPDGKMYGLISSFEPDSDLEVPSYPLPDEIKLVWDANEDVTGDFLFCFSTHTEKFKKYEIEPVILGWIKSFTPTDSGVKPDFIRNIKIAAIDSTAKVPGASGFKSIDVSFDYLNGTISDIKIKGSAGTDEDDASVLAAIKQTNYPVMPDELKEKKLHIDFPVYFVIDVVD